MLSHYQSSRIALLVTLVYSPSLSTILKLLAFVLDEILTLSLAWMHDIVDIFFWQISY